ncbi:hypothetical protein FHS60_001721 [Alloprevotella rava]|uniref:IS982 family transposase n=1 Tax=Alloprevotella rava TaxID=671218 RepID=A0A7W5YGL4_9BACT|nr:hypothetical protein [Alloprevotella rava]MBB3703241.1 hypothetical protein [Alloprevotella rava]
MKLVSKVTEIYCIADDFCKEYHLELNKTSLSLSNPSANSPKHRKRKGRMSDAEMITILILFHSNTFRNFKHFYLIYVCRELKKEFPDLLSYTRFVERMPRVAIPLLLDTVLKKCVSSQVLIFVVNSKLKQRTMKLTTEQRSELLSELASSEAGFNELFRVLLESFSKQERALFL